MCKIMCVAGIERSKTKQLWKFLLASVKPMSAMDQDGLGYAAVSASQDLFAERWLNPKDAFRLREANSPSDQFVLDNFGPAIEGQVKYNSHGTMSSGDTQAVILHSRMATCGVSIANTHPFISNNTALIHNGVISNSQFLTNITSTCDSEVILNEYVNSRVDAFPHNIQDVADSLVGYYACGILTQDKSGRWIMDIFKDARAELYCAFIVELNTTVFCTSDQIIKDTCKKVGFHVGTIFKVKDGNLIRIDVKTGKRLAIYQFDPGMSDSSYSSTYNDYMKKWADRDKEETERKMLDIPKTPTTTDVPATVPNYTPTESIINIEKYRLGKK